VVLLLRLLRREFLGIQSTAGALPTTFWCRALTSPEQQCTRCRRDVRMLPWSVSAGVLSALSTAGAAVLNYVFKRFQKGTRLLPVTHRRLDYALAELLSSCRRNPQAWRTVSHVPRQPPTNRGHCYRSADIRDLPPATLCQSRAVGRSGGLRAGVPGICLR